MVGNCKCQMWLVFKMYNTTLASITAHLSDINYIMIEYVSIPITYLYMLYIGEQPGYRQCYIL